MAFSPFEYRHLYDHHVKTKNEITTIVHQKQNIGAYLLSRKTLLSLLKHESQFATFDGLLSNFIPKKSKHFEHHAPIHQINNLEKYYQFHMNACRLKREQLHSLTSHLRSNRKDYPPTLHGKTAHVQNSIIGNGCRIYGTVENSVLFNNITIGQNTVIKNSIIFSNTTIDERCTLHAVVLDKHVTIGANVTMIGTESQPVVVGKGIKKGVGL
jgi:glucose-1-phosphate adenylyltransferase